MERLFRKNLTREETRKTGQNLPQNPFARALSRRLRLRPARLSSAEAGPALWRVGVVGEGREGVGKREESEGELSWRFN